MYSQLEEDYGLAKRSMLILERATQLVADEDKFEVSFSDWVIGLLLIFLLPLRCSQFISQKQQQTLVSQPRGQSTKRPLKVIIFAYVPNFPVFLTSTCRNFSFA